jgi:DNA-binding NarL/FixJ family response regulator
MLRNAAMGVSPERVLRVALVDDHEVVLSGLLAILEREPDVSVVGSFRSAEEALQGLHLLDDKPDVVVLDQSLPGMSGVAACRQILGDDLAGAAILLTSFSSEDVLRTCLAAGARGFMTKSVAGTELAAAIRAVARGEAVLSSDVTLTVIEWARDTPEGTGNSLTEDEIEIVRRIARGMSNRQISDDLYTSESAIKVSVRRIMRKLGVRRRWEAVAVSIDRGLLK